MRVTGLRLHPLKSGAPLEVESLDLEPWGARGDRRWAALRPDGTYLTARTTPRLLHVVAEPRPGGIRLRADDVVLDVDEPVDGAVVPVAFSRLDSARDAGDAAAALLTEALGEPLRLVWQPDPRERSVNPDNGGLPGEVLNLSDAGPLLLASEASLARLQEHVGESPRLAMGRFRPNVVVDGEEPWAEDAWTSVRIGDADLRVQQACDRCVMTTIDPATLERGKEPIASLARHHAWGGKTWFGVWLVPQPGGAARIAVGDAVRPA